MTFYSYITLINSAPLTIHLPLILMPRKIIQLVCTETQNLLMKWNRWFCLCNTCLLQNYKIEIFIKNQTLHQCVGAHLEYSNIREAEAGASLQGGFRGSVFTNN